ncbi:uncharacterized protein LOC128556876 isoform X2 [Mercenaria mercenaria]|uniref:uncharacterized protein LOC128556876 isoform X2 n=1 Tax=Mercenaria mercenaria TaxID=6596 RepID=UPI00234EFEB8|nr:uncharacterized protein LOC128556876 isoform X2 [Mercenaria mercenaria]
MEFKSIDLIYIIGVISCVVPCIYGTCEPGWYEYYDNCYYVSDSRYNHRDLEHACASRNASLWIWHSTDELKWMTKLVSQGARILYWTDLQLVNRRWKFMDGTPYNSRNIPWYRNKEGDRNSNSNKCAGLYSYKPDIGKIQARRCTDGWGTICVRPKAMLDLCDLADGWQYRDGRCLKFFDTPQSWFNARKTCQANQGDLTIYKNYDELRSLDSLITCRTIDNVAWIGLSDTVQPRMWRWINNDTVRYARWYSYGNQILKNGSTCSAASPIDGWAWRNYVCDTQLKFICNRSLGVCPAGWLQNQDRCYDPNVVDTAKKTWFDAKTYCESTGASLLVINSQQEQSFINVTLNSLKVNRAWLGFSDMNQSDTLQWLDGRLTKNASSYQLWDRNFPKPIAKRFDCGLIVKGLMDSRWSNVYCFKPTAFFCEMSITTVPFNPTVPPVNYICDHDWVLFRGECYYFGPVRNQSLKNWYDANDFCKSSGAQLVVIGNPYEMSFVTVQQSKIVTAWIGLKYDKSNDVFRWVDGSTPGQYWANETNFYPNEPDDYKNGQECIQIIGGRRDYTGSWDDGNCSIQQGFICEKNAVPKVILPPSGPPVPTQISPQCGFGWISSTSNNFCYQVVLGLPKTWQGAKAYCQQNGGDLLSISGVSEQNFVQAVLSSGKYASIQLNFWIGATDQTQEGGWHWNDNTPFRYLNWHPGEPNNVMFGAQPEDCAEMVPAWNYQWNDKYCSKEQVFICKKNALMTTALTVAPPTGFNKGNCHGEAMISGNYSLVDTRSFTSSTARDAQHLAINSRLFPGNMQAGGGWSAKTANTNQYIAVTFYNTIVVKGISTAGRTDVDEWVTQFKIQYQETYYSEWLTYNDPPGTVKIFSANNDSSTSVTNVLFFPFEAKQVKLVPVQWHQGISLRWEILGCLEESCIPDYAVSGPLVAMDGQLQASGVYDIAHDAKAARLRPVTQSTSPACWKPQTSDTNQWIQVDLGNVFVVRGVTVKGNPAAQEWVTQFRVKYGLDGTSFVYYQEPYGKPKTISGNVDNSSPVTYYFKSHFQAKFIRIQPTGWNTGIALAFDVLVCQNGCNGVALMSGKHHIADKQLSASSVLDNRHTVSRSRLNLPANGAYGGAWIPKYSDKQQYLKADLGFAIQITGVATQGAFDSGDWVKTYRLSYSNDNVKWVYYYELGSSPKVFDGNWENKIVRKHNLLIPFIARYILIYPQTWNSRIALRWELYGCPGAASGVRIGCFADDDHDRDLPFEPYTDPRVGMWPPMCVDHCFRKGYYYAGLQDQFKCFCGNSYGKYGPATDCKLSCFPKTNFQCGGPTSNIIYTTGMSPEFKICPTSWKSYNNRCYILILDKQSWYDARASCKSEGGDLASPNSQAEQDFVFSLLQYANGQSTWIGFNDIQDESVFNWADGRQVKYTNWGLNQPSHTANANQDCVLMQNKSGGWQDASCDVSHMFVCQMDKQRASKPVATVVPTGCQTGWDGYRWSCYLYGDAKRTWQESKAVCETFGGSLARIGDRYEQSYLSGVLGARTGQYWIDVNDLAQSGTYQHTVGRPSLAFTNWAKNKPDGTSQCVSIGSGNMTGLWSNQPCTNKAGLVCKKTRVGYTAPTLPSATTTLPPCDPGLIQTPSYCYQVNKVASHLERTWDEALDDCVSKGGNLASFHSAADIDYVWRNALVGTSTSFWIGLNDRASENGYVWTDGSAVNVLNWNVKQPDNYNGFEDCVEMWSSTSKWNDAACMSRNSWICMVKRGPGRHFTTLKTVTAPATQSSSLCKSLVGSGWVAYHGSCYRANDGNGDQGKSWRQARRTCQQSGGDLASILSQAEQAFIYLTLLKNISANSVWIGLNALDLNNGYKWSDGSVVTYYNWGKNEPNDAGGEEDCVDIFLRTGNWNDDHCSYQMGYICKVQLGMPPTPPVPTGLWAGNCPTGFNLLYNRCYRIYLTPVNWTTALANCKGLGSGYNLASILDDVTNAFITTMMAAMKVNPWIGLHKNWGNQLLWVNNDETTYTNWAHNEPNGKQKEACVQIMGYPGMVGQWNDVSCATTHGYVCMTKKDPTISTPEPVPSICDVKQGQKLFQTGCYFFVNKAVNWSAANDYCIQQGGGYLSSVNSGFEQAYIYLTMKQNHVDAVWIGLNDVKQSGTYSWTDGWPVLYTNWDAGQPVGGQGCVIVNSTGRWIDTNCTSKYPSICKISSASPSLTPPAPNGLCDPGWYSYSSQCYYLGVNVPRTALDAGFYCQQHKGALVSIHNQTVNQFLVKTMTSLAVNGQSFWTGLHKSIDSGFQWIDRSPVQYTNWRKGEPSTRGWSGNLENCAEVFLSDGKWNDEDCNSKRLFVCEKSPAVDISKIQIGTGGAPINVPTPIPFTRPSILPIQRTPSPPTNSISQKTPPTDKPPVTQKSQPTAIIPHVTVTQKTLVVVSDNAKPVTGALPSISVRPYTGGSTQNPMQQSADQESTSTTGLGMSSGALAGIILASVVIILLVVLIAMYWRRNTRAGKQTNFGLGNGGFENQIYRYDSQSEQVTETKGGLNLRTMSESSS